MVLRRNINAAALQVMDNLQESYLYNMKSKEDLDSKYKKNLLFKCTVVEQTPKTLKLDSPLEKQKDLTINIRDLFALEIGDTTVQLRVKHYTRTLLDTRVQYCLALF